MFSRVYRFVGSIQLAVPLLTIIITILIGATFYESKVGSSVVQQEIYKSPWFGALMFLLALNLGISALTRYPWRGARKIGFALTHLGLIVIIVGSAAVIHIGTEGLISLHTDLGVNNQLRVDGEVLEVMNSDGTSERADLFVKPNGSVNRQKLGGLTLLGYSDNTIETIAFEPGATVNNPAVRLSLHSDTMGQTIERWLAVAPEAYSKTSIGPAELEIVRVDNENQLNPLLNPPVAEAKSNWGIIKASSAAGKTVSIDIEKNLSKQINVDENTKIKVVNFWPDFRLDENKQPTTASQEPNNPVIQLEVSALEGVENWFIFGKVQLPPLRSLVSGKAIEGVEASYETLERSPQGYFKAIITPTGQLYYSSQSSKGSKSGTLEVGQSVSPGWADFQITLEEFISNAQPKREYMPVSDPSVAGVPALLVKTEAGTTTWLPWAEPQTINEPQGDILAAFGPLIRQIPFGIALEEFIVDRNEGSESVAMWTSRIKIEDPENENITHRQVWMNHPTWYRGWKISQASWNPEDLGQSTLQVKREPALVTALTWIGSVLVVLGITVMFYGPAIAKKFSNKPKEESILSPENETQELAASN
jgi:ResB-like family